MMHPNRRKGVKAELEVAGQISDLLGINCVRRYNLGTHEDTGDLVGVPATVIQVANYTDIARAVREKLPETEAQRHRANATFAALWVRRYGGSYVVVQTPAMWATYAREVLN